MINLSTCYPFVPEQETYAAAAFGQVIAADRRFVLSDQDDKLSITAHIASRLGVAYTKGAIPTASGQSALAATFLHLSRRSSKCAIEECTFPLAIEVLRRLGVDLIPVKSDGQGMLPADLAAAAKAGAGFVFMMPSVHNPLGITTPKSRLEEIAGTVLRYGLRVVEDCAFAFLDNSPEFIAPLAPDNTIQIFSLLKIFSPSTRMGFVKCPLADEPSIADAVRTLGAVCNPLVLSVVGLLCEQRAGEALTSLKIAEGLYRRDIAREILRLPPPIAVPSAWHFRFEVPPHMSGDEFARASQARGVAVQPGSAFRPDASDDRTVRISLGGENDRSRMIEGLCVLRSICQT